MTDATYRAAISQPTETPDLVLLLLSIERYSKPFSIHINICRVFICVEKNLDITIPLATVSTIHVSKYSVIEIISPKEKINQTNTNNTLMARPDV